MVMPDVIYRLLGCVNKADGIYKGIMARLMKLNGNRCYDRGVGCSCSRYVYETDDAIKRHSEGLALNERSSWRAIQCKYIYDAQSIIKLVELHEYDLSGTLLILARELSANKPLVHLQDQRTNTYTI